MYETIKTELQDGILTLTLNRPDNMNAYTEKMNEELLHFYREVNGDDSVRVIVVTGSGRAFCAGMDLSEGGSTFSSEQSSDEYRDLGGQVSMQVYEVNKPIIAAINGPAVGIGMTMTLPMDIRIVKKDTKIGFVFGRRGIGPEAASGWFLPRVVGIGKALEWTLTGRYIPTAEAVESGLMQYESEDPLAKLMKSHGKLSKTQLPLPTALRGSCCGRCWGRIIRLSPIWLNPNFCTGPVRMRMLMKASSHLSTSEKQNSR